MYRLDVVNSELNGTVTFPLFINLAPQPKSLTEQFANHTL